MKVKELMEVLSKLDPELEVTDGVSSLYTVEVLPAYYDGCYTKLKQDHSLDPYYNIVGARIESEGMKVRLRFLGWEDVIADGCTDIEYTNYSEKYRMGVENFIKEMKLLNEEIRN